MLIISIIFCLSSALFLPDAVACVEAFALGRQEKEVISEAEVSSPLKIFPFRRL